MLPRTCSHGAERLRAMEPHTLRAPRVRLLMGLLALVPLFVFSACGGVGTLDWEGGDSDDNDYSPSAPTGLRAWRYAETGVHLTWFGSTTSTGIVGYEVFRDGDFLLTSDRIEADDPTSQRGTAYRYEVRAIDNHDRRSPLSASFTVDPWWVSAPVLQGIHPAYRVSVGIALDGAGGVHVAYVDAALKAVRHAWSVGGTWSVETAGSYDRGPYEPHTTIRIAAGSDGALHIGYVDTLAWQLIHLEKRSGSTSWARTVVDTDPAPSATLPNMFPVCSLGVGASGNPFLGYTVGRVARCATREALNWTVTPFGPTSPYEVVVCDLEAAPGGSLNAAFALGGGGQLQYATGGPDAWVPEQADGPAYMTHHRVSSSGTSFVLGEDVLAIRQGGLWTTEDILFDGHDTWSMACDPAGQLRLVVGLSPYVAAFAQLTRTPQGWDAVPLDSYCDEYAADIVVDTAGKSHVAYIRSTQLRYATNR